MKQVEIKTDHKREAAKFLEKIVINAGVGRLSSQPNFAEKNLVQLERDLALITGQRPEVRPVKKSIAGFKIREGQIVGLRVTLRRKRMVDFFERLIKMILPRVRDFSGLRLGSVDAGGVLNVGIKEQLVFPEVNPEQSPLAFSLGISIVPKTRNRAKAIEGFNALGVPLKIVKHET